MFTLIRPVSAVVLSLFAYFAALEFWPLYRPEVEPGNFPWYVVRVSALVGWFFVGNAIGRSWWFSAYIGIQGVVLTAVGTAMYLAVGEVFVLGYRRRYPEVMDAIAGYFEIIMDWLRLTLDRDFLILMGVGGAVVGLILHALWLMMEARRNAR